LKSHQSFSYSRISQHFIEFEGSLPCSQELSTGPYPEPVESSPYQLIKTASQIKDMFGESLSISNSAHYNNKVIIALKLYLA
jgi:hypothetical protein